MPEACTTCISDQVFEVKFDSDAYEMKCWYRDLRQLGELKKRMDTGTNIHTPRKPGVADPSDYKIDTYGNYIGLNFQRQFQDDLELFQSFTCNTFKAGTSNSSIL